MRSTLKKSLSVALILGALTADSLLAQSRIQLVSYGSTWKYDDSGTDLGTNWRTPGFNDAAWQSGPGAMGYPTTENLLGLTSVQTLVNRYVTGNSGPQVITFYYRIKFQWTESPQGVVLTATNLIDDGAVFYLNGNEVGRVAMPDGAPTFMTMAARADDISAHGFEVLEFPASALVQGENVLAVEVHQGGATSSDAILAMSLIADLPASGPVVITTQPMAQGTTIGNPVTFTVGLDGTPPYTFQWRKDGANIPGANGQSYTINSPTLGDAGEYSVFVSNAIGSDTSDPALLSVTAPPIVLIPWNQVWRFNDTATDLGTAWRQNSFNDASWSSGAGPFGFETAAIAVPIATPLADSDQLTYYFRTTFQFTNEPLDVELTFTNQMDDGAVIYINEQEVLRVGMAVGTVTYGTAAGRTVGDAALETFVVPAEALVKGLNRIAVESHQVNTTSSDIVMGLSLAASFLPPTPITITNQPQDVVVEELKQATFEVGITGNAPRYQWFKDGAPIMGALARRFIIPSASVADQGQYHVVISNVVAQVSSRRASLTVLADTNGPVLLSADGTLNLTNIIVSFDEPIDMATATATGNYTVSNVTMGGTLAISSAVLTNATNVVLSTAARVLEQNYLLFARNVRDINPRQNVIAAGSATPVSALLLLIRPIDPWDFYDPVPPFDPPVTGTSWRNFGFNPNAEGWGNGPGGFVFDLNNQDLPLTRGTILSQGATTKYFRKTFDFRGSPAGADLRLLHVVDDGAIFYLNGTEFYRYNMPDPQAGPVTGDTISAAAIGVATFVVTNIPANLLSFGANLLAVEVHGRAPNDQDWVFGLDLQAKIDSYATGRVLIARQPLSRTVTEGQPVTFDFVGVGGGRFQWQRNDVNIVGATNSTFPIVAAPLDWSGSTFRVMVSNNSGNVTSDRGTLTVVADTERPLLLSAFGLGNQVTVNFNETLNMASALTLANYRITNSAVGMRGISAARLTNGNQVVLTTATSAQVGDVIIVNNVTDDSEARNAVLPNSAATIGFESLLLPIDSTWKYNDTDTDFGTSWRDFAFNDSAWPSGQALLGQESASTPVIVRTAVSAPGSGGPLTSYYRAHFNFPGVPSAGMTLTLNHIIDDGAVFFLNGQEVYRIGVNVGEVHGTVASRTVGDGVWEGPFILSVPSLRAGDNVFAVANHQINATSSDTLVGAELLMAPVPSRVITQTDTPTSLTITRLGNGMVQVDWSGEGFVLEQTSSLATPVSWTSVPGQPNPHVFTPGGTMQVFRLRQ